MTTRNSRHPGAPDDDRSGHPEVEKIVSVQPVSDTEGELDDSADSYVSPARTAASDSRSEDPAADAGSESPEEGAAAMEAAENAARGHE